MLNRPLPAPARDIAMLIARVILGVVLFAHGWQKLMINGISETYGQFEKLGIPLAIVSASFTSFVEFVGGVLIILGALTTTVVALDLIVMVGAAGFVHITNGIFAKDGGWELVGVIVAVELALAAFGPGCYSVDHLVARRRDRERADLDRRRRKPIRQPVAVSEAFTPAVEVPAGAGGMSTGAFGTGGFGAVAPANAPTGAFAASSTAPTGAFAAVTPASARVATGGFAATPATPSTPTAAIPAVAPTFGRTSTGAFPAAAPAAPAGAFAPATPSASTSAFTADASDAPASAVSAAAAAAPSASTGAFRTDASAASAGAFAAAALAASSASTGAFTSAAPAASANAFAPAAPAAPSAFSGATPAAPSATTGAFAAYAAATPAASTSVSAAEASAAPSGSAGAATVDAAAAPGASTGAFPAQAAESPVTDVLAVVPPAAVADPAAEDRDDAGDAAREPSPRMASAGVHRAMSERAGRSAEAPAPFGVTVQSPLDFTPTTAMPVVPPMSVETDTITVATSVPGGLPRRVRAADLPPASAVRPYA